MGIRSFLALLPLLLFLQLPLHAAGHGASAGGGVVRYEVIPAMDLSDTLVLDSGRLLIVKDGAILPPDTLFISSDTLRPFFLNSGLPVYRIAGRNSWPPVRIVVPGSALPAAFPAGSLAVYRDTANSLFNVFATVTADGSLSLPMNRALLNTRLCILADTLTPRLLPLNAQAPVVASAAAISDTIIITDNCSNLRFRLDYGSGADAWRYHDSVFVPQGDTFVIAPSDHKALIVSSVYGYRARLIVDDGINADTMDLSRRVFRATGDNVVLPDTTWQPIGLRYDPSNGSSAANFDSLFSSLDRRQGKLARWLNGQWIFRDSAGAAAFAVSAGDVVWGISRDQRSLRLSPGSTSALDSPAELSLPAEDWIDFVPPFAFDIRLADILAANPGLGDSVGICRWIADTGGTWYAEWLFRPGFDDASSSIDTLSGRGYFCAYNASRTAVSLHIPPVCAALSPVDAALARKREADAEIVHIRASDSRSGAGLGRVDLRYDRTSRDERSGPLAPSFGDIAFAVRSGGSDRAYMACTADSTRADTLVLRNAAAAARSVHLAAEYQGSHASFRRFAALDPASEDGGEGLILTVPAGGTSRILFGAHGGNRVQSSVPPPVEILIRQSASAVHFSGKAVGSLLMQVTVTNLAGRQIHQGSGRGGYAWADRGAAGVFVAHIEFFDSAGKSLCTTRRTLFRAY